MTDKTSSPENIDFHLYERILGIESSIKLVEAKIPSNLSDRLTVIEQKFNNEVGTLKRDLEDSKNEARLKMIERLAYVAIIVGLLTTLITSKIFGGI